MACCENSLSCGPCEEVMVAAYQTAKSMNASDKVILALFETGLVESNFVNLQHLGAKNDHDSVGFLQQRPSMGWPNPRDVPTATRSFVSKAIRLEPMYKNSSAGRLAQAVQVSAFPSRYDQRQAQAQSLINKVANKTAGTGGAVTTNASAAGIALPDFSALIKAFQTLGDPYTWKRVGMFIAGGVIGAIAFALIMRGTRPAQIVGETLEAGVKAGLKAVPAGRAGSVATKAVKQLT